MTKTSEANSAQHEEFETMLTIAHYYSARSACLGQQSLVRKLNIVTVFLHLYHCYPFEVNCIV